MNPLERVPPRRQVVVIEDDLVFLSLIEELLTDEGYQVRAHSAAEPGWAAIQEAVPDVVLLDLHLGQRGEGWQLLDRLVLNPQTRSVPVVLMTGDLRALEQRAPVLRREQGIATLPKPFDLDTLLQVLETMQPRPVVSVPAEGVAAPRQPILRLVASA